MLFLLPTCQLKQAVETRPAFAEERLKPQGGACTSHLGVGSRSAAAAAGFFPFGKECSWEGPVEAP